MQLVNLDIPPNIIDDEDDHPIPRSFLQPITVYTPSSDNDYDDDDDDDDDEEEDDDVTNKGKEEATDSDIDDY